MKAIWILTSPEYVRNYVETGVIAQTGEGGGRILIHERLASHPRLKESDAVAGIFRLGRSFEKWSRTLFDILMLRNWKRSRTFRWRHLRQTQEHRNSLRQRSQQAWCKVTGKDAPDSIPQWMLAGGLLAVRSPKFLFRWLGEWCRLRLVECLAFLRSERIYQQVLEWLHTPSPSLESALRDVDPDLVLIPTQAIDPVGYEILRLRPMGYRVLFLIDNWDNLSSKSIFPAQPDYLGVWGQQSVEHAMQIHDFPEENIFRLGTPRFDTYYDVRLHRDSYLPRPYPFPYYLFVGCSIAYDETAVLQRCDELLKEHNRDREEPVRMVYRPHPWRAPRIQERQFQETDFSYTILDEQVRENYYQSAKKTFQPSLDYYPRLLGHCQGVVGPLTTMLLESSLCYKPVLGLALDDGVHITSPSYAMKYYLHFNGIENIPGFDLCADEDDFEASFRTFLGRREESIDRPEHDRVVSYFLYQDEQRYVDRLNRALESIGSAAGT
jgi:hypothetical protein